MAFGVIKKNDAYREVVGELVEQAKAQKAFGGSPKSLDPENYPVFSFEDKKYLVYVPSLVLPVTETTPQILEDLGNPVETPFWDRVISHSVTDGSTHLDIRCTQGLQTESGTFDGTCPICEAMNEVNADANIKIKKALKAKGISDAESEEGKKEARDVRAKRVLKPKNIKYTFALAFFEVTEEKTANGRGTQLKVICDEEGYPKYQIMWYSISHKMFVKQGKWKTALEQGYKSALDNDMIKTEEDEAAFNSIAGNFFEIDAHYTENGWKPMNAALEFGVSYRSRLNGVTDKVKLQETLDKIDEIVKEKWTPLDSASTVIANYYRPVADTRREVERLMEPVRTALMLAELGDQGAIESTQPAQKQLEQGSDLDDLSSDDLD